MSRKPDLLSQARKQVHAMAPAVPIKYLAAPADPAWAAPVFPSDRPSPLTDHVRYVAEQQQVERQRIEDLRAVRRNRNRALTLLGALVISFVITGVLQSKILGMAGVMLAPYAFCITILMDSTFTIYAWVKRY